MNAGCYGGEIATPNLDALAAADGAKGVELIGRLVDDGRDLRLFVRRAIEHARALVFTRATGNPPEAVSEQMAAKLRAQAQGLSLDQLAKIAKRLIETEQHLRTSEGTPLPLELAILDLVTSSEKVAPPPDPRREPDRPAATRPTPPSPARPEPRRDAPRGSVVAIAEPFGHDLASARMLNQALTAIFDETQAMYRSYGVSQFSGCLPILLQSPFFFGLFRVLNNLQKIANGNIDPIGPITRKLAAEAESSTFFGAQLSDRFLGDGGTTVKIVTVILIIAMSASTFTTQRQLMMKNMPASALDNPFAKQQKMLLYLMPIFFAISGVNFPIGVLLYWLTTNVWSMCQQFYVIRNMPAPGSQAEKAMQERRRKKGKPVQEFTVKGLDKSDEVEAPKPSGQ